MQGVISNTENDIAAKYHQHSAQDYLKIFGFTQNSAGQTGRGVTPGDTLVEPSIRSEISVPQEPMGKKRHVKAKCKKPKRCTNKKTKQNPIQNQYGGKKQRKPSKKIKKFPFFKD